MPHGSTLNPLIRSPWKTPALGMPGLWTLWRMTTSEALSWVLEIPMVSVARELTTYLQICVLSWYLLPKPAAESLPSPVTQSAQSCHSKRGLGWHQSVPLSFGWNSFSSCPQADWGYHYSMSGGDQSAEESVNRCLPGSPWSSVSTSSYNMEQAWGTCLAWGVKPWATQVLPD